MSKKKPKFKAGQVWQHIESRSEPDKGLRLIYQDTNTLNFVTLLGVLAWDDLQNDPPYEEYKFVAHSLKKYVANGGEL